MAQSVLRQFSWRREVVARRTAASEAATREARTTLLRTITVAACALSIGVAGWIGDPSGYLETDLALAHLLRAMAVIKGMVALAALGAVLWRFGWPVSKPVSFGYVAGSSVLAGSTMLIWQLSYIPLAAVLFHAAAACMLIIGWREK
jgi:hypothetical protein